MASLLTSPFSYVVVVVVIFKLIWIKDVCYITAVLCPEAPNIPNANLISSSRNVGAIAEYDCDLGFSVTGESLTTTKFRITCLLKADQISANWTVAPTCECNINDCVVVRHDQEITVLIF